MAFAMSGFVKHQRRESATISPRSTDSLIMMASTNTAKRTTSPESYLFLGVQIRILLDSEQTGGQFCTVEGIMPPGEAPPLHMHLREDESMLQLEGELEVTVGDDVFMLRPGEAYFAPRGVPHRLRNVGTAPARSIATMTPGGFDALVRRIGIPVIDGVPAAPPAPPTPAQFEALVRILADHGIVLPPGGSAA
jgi:mannose-6-phosphate isomerase-like protein (cupin superfamily)